MGHYCGFDITSTLQLMIPPNMAAPLSLFNYFPTDTILIGVLCLDPFWHIQCFLALKFVRFNSSFCVVKQSATLVIDIWCSDVNSFRFVNLYINGSQNAEFNIKIMRFILHIRFAFHIIVLIVVVSADYPRHNSILRKEKRFKKGIWWGWNKLLL